MVYVVKLRFRSHPSVTFLTTVGEDCTVADVLVQEQEMIARLLNHNDWDLLEPEMYIVQEPSAPIRVSPHYTIHQNFTQLLVHVIDPKPAD